MRCVIRFLICAASALTGTRAQNIDPALLREAAAVRAEIARSLAGLRPYVWTETTEVLVNGSLRSSSASLCQYDATGRLSKTLLDPDKNKSANPISKRPVVRSKADMDDYIRRAVSRIAVYLPPKPDEIDFFLQKGYAVLGTSEGERSEVRFTRYYEPGDSLVFTFDSVSKVLLKVTVASTLGGPKDPVTMEAVFERLPDGINHMSAATLNAPAKKVQVKIQNSGYQKMAI